MVIAPAKTGKESNNKIVVNRTDQTNKGIRSVVIEVGRILIIVVIKLILPKIDEIPARWREKIARSTLAPEWKLIEARGGYTVHPVPAPVSIIEDNIRRESAGGSNQNLILFIRGKAISGALSIRGINQFPKPPIIAGITMKKIISRACEVRIVLYICPDINIWGRFSSLRTK